MITYAHGAFAAVHKEPIHVQGQLEAGDQKQNFDPCAYFNRERDKMAQETFLGSLLSASRKNDNEQYLIGAICTMASLFTFWTLCTLT